jgi:sugar phosphate isomerase/epimerase
MTAPIALQLYTLREEMAQDFEGILRQVAELGYVGVELAGTGGLSAAQVRELLDKYGLKASSAHVPLEVLETDITQAVEDAKTIGYSVIAVPYLMPNRRGDRAGYLQLAATLNSIGAELKKHGLQLAYHNHDFEFVQFDGEYALDLIYANTDPENLKAELDVYWIQYAGVDPVAYVSKYVDRAPLIHLKDMTNDDERFFAEVGEGTVNIDGVIAAATGAQWLIVEQDRSRRTPLESVKISIDNLRAKGYL